MTPTQPDLQATPEPETVTTKRQDLTSNSSGGRLLSLDFFRGLTIALMILVNNAGSDTPYWPLSHAKWNGWTPTQAAGWLCRKNVILREFGRVYSLALRPPHRTLSRK